MKLSTIKSLTITILTLSVLTIAVASIFSSSHEITSAVFADKVKDSIGLETNGLTTASIAEAWEADKSTIASVKFMRCSVSLPEFRFVTACHKAKAGKTEMNAESLASLVSYKKLYNDLKDQQVNRNMLDVLHITGIITKESLKRM